MYCSRSLYRKLCTLLDFFAFCHIKGLVFRRPQPTEFDMPDPLDGIAQERAAKLLVVIFTGKLSFEDHVEFVMTLCSQSVYLLKLLRSQGLRLQQLHMVFVALILCHIIMHSQSRDGTSPDSYKYAWMLFLNGLESLVFVMQIIPWPNYLTRQMLGLYKDQNTVFIIFY